MSDPIAPPVRKLWLFKHGIAHLEHGGPVSGPISLSFEREVMSDVLKTLTAWVPSEDATIPRVAFDAPEDPEEALSERGLAFADGATFHGLLDFLRGRRVRVQATERIEGEVVGLQRRERAKESAQLVLRTQEGSLRVVDVAEISLVTPLDPNVAGELSFLTEKRRASTSRARRSVEVGVSGPAEELRIAYALPAPVWRVSYRLVIGAGDTAGDASDEATADDSRAHDGAEMTLMAWAIVHNPVDQALEDVELVLTTGEPVSFHIDLYRPKTVTRREVEARARGGAAPIAFATAGAPEVMRGDVPAAPAPGMAPNAKRARMRGAAMSAASPAAAVGQERGEAFEYRIEAPVSLARGGSAMVPIANARVPVKRERIWRAGSGASPSLVLSFDNDTGVVLEEGAAVIFEEGGYAGEAMVPFTARKAPVRIRFATDLAIRCSASTKARTEFSSLDAQDAFLVQVQESFVEWTVRVESDHDETKTVAIEIDRRPSQRAEAEGVEVESAGAHWRCTVEVPPRSRIEQTITLREHVASRVRIAQAELAQVRGWLQHLRESGQPHEALSAAAEAMKRSEEASQRADVARARATEIRARQAGLTEQLGVLRDGGEEGEIRIQVVRELRAAEEEAATADAEAAEASRARHDADVEARAALARIEKRASDVD